LRNCIGGRGRAGLTRAADSIPYGLHALIVKPLEKKQWNLWSCERARKKSRPKHLVCGRETGYDWLWELIG